MEEELLESSNFKLDSFKRSTSGCSDFLLTVQNSLFGAFSIIYSYKEKTSIEHKINEKISQICINSVICLQLIRLNWRISFDTQNSVDKHWRVLGYASFDQIFADLGLLFACIIICGILIAIPTIFILFLSIKSYKGLSFDSHLIFIPKAILSIFSTIGFAPCTLMFMLVLKYSLINEERTAEYESCDNCNMNFGLFGVFFSLINLFLLPFLVYGREITSAELRHTFASDSLNSRAHSYIDLEMITFSFISPIIFVLFNQYRFYYHQMIITAYSAYIVYKTIKHFPYYNLFSNASIIARNSEIFFTSLAFIFGEAIDNNSVTIAIFWIINPILIFIILSYATKKFYSVTENKYFLINQYEFEKHYRYTLMDDSCVDRKKMLDEFHNGRKTKRFNADKLFIIWETNYCLYILRDERLARLKFNKSFSLESQMEGRYQEWKIHKLLEKNNTGIYEDICTIYYFLELDKIKRKDKILCNKMMDFWSEIISQNPRIGKLSLLLNHVHETLDSVNKGYKNLLKTFPDRSACHDLYNSLETQILRKNKSRSSAFKKDNLSLVDHHESKNKFMPFSDSNGFLIVSADKSTFGDIVYANSTVSQILNQAISTIVGSKLETYIPAPYSWSHARLMKNYIKKSINLQSSIRMSHFLQTERGYIVECFFRVYLVSLIKHIYFIAVMKPVSKKRECALLSVDGQIYAHSESFLQKLQCTKLTGNNENIEDLIPSLNFSSLLSHVPVRLTHENQIILCVLIKIKLSSTILNLFLLVNDETEIEEWKNGDDDWQKVLVEKCPNNFEIIKNSNRLTIHEESDEDTRLGNTELFENKADDKMNINTAESSISSINFLSVEEKMKKSAEKILKLIKWILIVSIFIVIFMNIGIFLYISTEVSLSNDLANVKNLASYIQQITILGYTSRMLELSTKHPNINETFYESAFNESLNLLDSLHENIIDDYDLWSYCSSSDVVQQELIPIWNRNSLHPISYHTLYDVIGEFMSHGKSFLKLFQQNEYYLDDEFFLIINGLGESYKILNGSLSGLIECEKKRVEDDDEMILVLVFIAIMLLSIISTILLVLIANYHQKNNQIWNYIRKKAINVRAELFQICFDRLSLIHNSIPDQQEFQIKKYSKMHSVYEKSYIKFVLVCSILIITSILCDILIGYYFYPLCKDNLIKRYELIEAYYIRACEISEACYWAAELALGKNDSSSELLFPHYSFADPNHMLSDVIDRYDASVHITSNERYRELFSRKLEILYFEKYPDAPNIIYHLGSYIGAILLRRDFTFYAYSNVKDIVKQIDKFINRAWILQTLIRTRTPVFDEGSKDYVNSQVNYIFNVVLYFGIFLVAAYFILCWPVIISENHKLENIYEISKLIPYLISKDKIQSS
ncbi:unnamed protein product [Blepharisma stoltei]|uniref:TmcB/TmcC TPR repeats domain-containing protein n=1 Tax=Blepharisma stoltei TaxID=1481888 RepID=A0AAU9IAR0_9CILI|nr:unnamed protein product [Blepharisma stoltei]